jgi:hypothetical protein
MIFQHDGARAHFHNQVDLFLWGYVKERIFQEIPTTREDMMERIQQAFAAIRRETPRPGISVVG